MKLVFNSHSGESRNPDFQRTQQFKVWVPTFVGMTEYTMSQVKPC